MKWILVFALLTGAGCGSLKIREKDDQALRQIKTVAVVAFSEYQPAPKKLILNLSKSDSAGSSGGGVVPQQSEHVDEMYRDLAASLTRNMNWKVADKKSMRSNTGYIRAYKETMEGWQNKVPPGEGEKLFLVGGLMDAECLRILGPQGRDRLLEDLKVDAVVVAQVRVGLNGNSMVGVGDLYPQARVSFQVYSKGKEEPVWFDGEIAGEQSHESVGKTAFFDESQLSALAAQSAKTAFQKIGTN
jgi:hypothetical protein